ncbi:hypothetical protein PSA01_16340 [Pseudonocardia saturnea]|uniref:Uncharacterized protein n=1 Tax=Pseudonocardia saturnea TaxID=33909 RepID=A0ABQ0RVA0_9PSEU|nr:hypothetical protein Pdca_45560 [Pseudonocardia autotrophica]GEC24605.1 hypothetical protein PSA01_16340 [Pseudonocardia saturnea]
MLTRPIVGRSPVTPLSAEGRRIDPPVSVPSAPKQDRVATATPEPPLEPPGILVVSQGLVTDPWSSPGSAGCSCSRSANLGLPIVPSRG